MCDVELENEDAMEGMSDGASAVRDDADVVFEKHSGNRETPLILL